MTTWMALFGLVWLLRVRGSLCGCAACRRARHDAQESQSAPSPRAPSPEEQAPFDVITLEHYTRDVTVQTDFDDEDVEDLDKIEMQISEESNVGNYECGREQSTNSPGSGRQAASYQASSLDELKMKYVEIIIECSNNYPITAADMLALRSKTMPDSESIRCLFACVYKKAGMMNEQGELSVDGVNKLTRKYLSDDPVKIQKSEEFTEACKSVNDIAVSDGERGCERAALIFKCTVEKAPDFDLL